ncbi:MAG: H4MPT-linked C1 transfer pathway protein, partial [Planctomycetaceae bacterium]
STTSDLIPLWQGRPCSKGTTDFTRLLAGELVYSGVRRTPVCALPGDVSLFGGTLRPAAELFATTLDVWLLLGEIAESELDCDTANGRPATRLAAIDRLARSFCCDRTELSAEDVLSVARQFAAAQEEQLTQALKRVTAENTGIFLSVIVSGSGSFLARRVIAKNSSTESAEVVSLDSHLTPEIAAAAPACAVAVLAHEETHGVFQRDLLPHPAGG